MILKQTNKIVSIIFLFITLTFYAQITKVVYKNNIYGKNINDIIIDPIKTKDLPSNQVKLLESMFKSEANVEFELLFDKNICLYQMVDKLDLEDESISILKNLYNKKYYCDIKNNEKLYQTDHGGLLNVTIPFGQYNWNITSETKIINGYKCYKATTVHYDIYNPIKKTKNIFYPVVWFTPDVATSFGPKGLDGLPGLILEATINGKAYIYATKIEFNIVSIKIEKPKGKNITEQDLENILIEENKKRVEESK